MTTSGLSLAGFLEEGQAVHLLRSSCKFTDISDAALKHQWRTAVAKRGTPIQRAGFPELRPLPASCEQHIAKLKEQPWFVEEMDLTLKGAAFQMVELETLLAGQFHVDISRCSHHCQSTSAEPTEAEILGMCLPLDLRMENVSVDRGRNSMLVRSKGMNFYPAEEGWLERDCGIFVGIRVAAKLPLLHVVRYEGRCYLHNGFHRAVGLLQRGISHAPCVLREIQHPSSGGIGADNTFSRSILESADPPTVAHFTTERALEVDLKTYTRTIHVSWSDHIVTDD